MYVLITAGEVMFSITGLDFAYSQVREVCCVVIFLLTIRLDMEIMICGDLLVLLEASKAIVKLLRPRGYCCIIKGPEAISVLLKAQRLLLCC